MRDDPLEELDREYAERVGGLSATQQHREALHAPFRLIEEARGLVDRAEATLAAIRTDVRAGRISTEQAPKLRRTAIEGAERDVQARLVKARAGVEVLPTALEREVFPPVLDRNSATLDAKGDLRLVLDHVADEELPNAFLSAFEQAISGDDVTATKVLMSRWGRDYLRSRLGEDAGPVWKSLREQAMRVAEPHVQGAEGAALRLRLRQDDIEKAYLMGMHALDMRLARLKES